MIDAHNHIQSARFDGQIENILTRAHAAGVAWMVSCATSEADWRAVLNLAQRHHGIQPALGIHPWFCHGVADGWPQRLERLLLDHQATVGEIGLDHAVPDRDDALQEDLFITQLRLAKALGRPASIHCRRAWGRMRALLDQEAPYPGGLLLHAYSGGAELIPDLAALDAWFSFSGTVTFSRNKRARHAAAVVPSERLLVETDAPDMLPAASRPPGAANQQAEQKRPNEPANLTHVVAALADIRGVPWRQIAQTTTTNAMRLFQLESSS